MRQGSFALRELGVCLLGAILVCTTVSRSARAQTPAAGGPPSTETTAELQEVVVTGFRLSLQKSTEAKRAATGIAESVFAEDIGKFPDTNIAEAFNRIPGVTIVRDTDGEGLNVGIRGLGPQFTRVLLNNAPVAIASTGRTDAQNQNREVDLDMFPTELFTQLTVNKTSSPQTIEGGAGGTVNMRSARPFDYKGTQVTGGVQATKNSNANGWGERGYLLASKTWDSGFGILIGGAGVHSVVNTTGFETIGWTNPNLTSAQCSGSCNTTGGGNWTIPATVPANAGNGLTPGTPINQAFLLAHNPGLTIQQIDNAIIPRLGRPSDEFGSRDRYNGILSAEFRPNENLHFYVDSLYGHKQNDEQRIDMNWVGRNGAAIPLNMQVDRSDCSQGCVVTAGTYANSQFFLEYRPYKETTDFWGVNPGFDWQIGDQVKFDLQANKTQSTFHRESPTVLVITPASSGVTVNYANNGGIPSITTNVDLNNPANFGWPGGRVNIQDEKRDTDTKGVRGDLTWGKGGPVNLTLGAAYDDTGRSINPLDNSQAWQNAVCGDNPNVYLLNPNTQPPCQGLATATPGAGYPTYPGLGTFYTAGTAGPLVYQGSLIPASALGQYLSAGPDGFITVNWNQFKGASNYATFHANPLAVGAANTGANGGTVREKVRGAYFMLSGDTTMLGHRLRYAGGVRWVYTEQTIGGMVSVPDPRNTPPSPQPAPKDGGKYPNIITFATTQNTYSNALPSFESAYNFTDRMIFRAAASKTLTRPDPSAMLPGLNFGDPSAAVGTVGNSALGPYISENWDFALEYYTGQEGYAAATWFHKRVGRGFTIPGTATEPFSALSVYGVTYDTLNPTQQAAINARGGPSVATVVLQEQVNASSALVLKGWELNWVQPLNFLLARYGVEGLGFSANYTHVNQIGQGTPPPVALNVPKDTWNLTLYYEHGPVSVHLSQVYNAAAQTAGFNQNGIPLAALYSNSYRQWDFSSSLDLGTLLHWRNSVQLTLDGINLANENQRAYFQFPNAAFTNYNAGRELLIGVRTKF